MRMQKILSGIIVDKMIEEINDNSQLWNQHNLRTNFYPNSPHREVDDIWLRYRNIEEFDKDNPYDFAKQHKSEWYPSSNILVSVKETIEKIVDLCEIDELGGCLITRIPPYKMVYRHNDGGHWHSEYYKDKYLLLLKSNDSQEFCFDEERHSGIDGDLFIFDNRHDHWVTNPTNIDRISLIIAGRKN